MSSFKVLVGDKIAADGVEVLRAAGFVADVKVGLSPEALAGTIGEYDGLIVRSACKARGDAFWTAAAGKLKAIGRAGSGVDNIDLEAATANGTWVMNTPGGNNNAVAELVLGAMFALGRHLVRADVGMKDGRWEKSALMGEEIEGKTLGIVGLGAIGRIVAAKAGALGMKVLAFDPVLDAAAAKAAGADLVSLDALLAAADVVTLHVPLLPATRNLIDAGALAKMKPSAWLIDAARGGIVDEPALVAALDAGGLAAAAMDVFSAEPVPADDRLSRHPKVLATPHIGASTRQAQEKVGVQIAEQLVAFLRDGVVTHPVNRLG
ncbi:MAG: hydroxyacid dehydrogenase [Deltaproteobacteria bacterium]|nr:hydroxyacid dehydrogenase [Deltaproteobacteria bacterium]